MSDGSLFAARRPSDVITPLYRRPSINPRLSIVVPAKNEARNLEVVLPQLPPVHEVILVDGHSVDDTIATAKRLMPDIRVVVQTRKGKGNALACGFAAVTGDIVVMFDADGSANPAEIPKFVNTLLTGADFAKGSRFMKGGASEDITAIRKLGNSCLNGLANMLLGTDFSDLCYGYNAFWADIIPTLSLPALHLDVPHNTMVWGDGFEIETLLNCRVASAKLKIIEVASVERLRVFGGSNLNATSDGLRVLRTMVFEWRRAAAGRRAVAAPAITSGRVRRPTSVIDLRQVAVIDEAV